MTGASALSGGSGPEDGDSRFCVGGVCHRGLAGFRRLRVSGSRHGPERVGIRLALKSLDLLLRLGGPGGPVLKRGADEDAQQW